MLLLSKLPVSIQCPLIWACCILPFSFVMLCCPLFDFLVLVQAIGEVLGALKIVAMQAKSLVNEESNMTPVKVE